MQIIFQVVLVLRFQTPPSLLPAILVYPQLRIGKTRGVDDRILAASHRESGREINSVTDFRLSSHPDIYILPLKYVPRTARVPDHSGLSMSLRAQNSRRWIYTSD